jgi:expansin (peptidoglycan-binding protein)
MKFTLALMVAALATAAAFNGDATYYSGAGKGGSCTSDYVPAGFKTVALNAPQYANGAMCGACISLTFQDGAVGKVSVNAIVDNLCPECKWGDLDMVSNTDNFDLPMYCSLQSHSCIATASSVHCLAL